MTWHVVIVLDLDHALVEALTARHPGLSRTEAIERAISAYLEGEAVERLLSLVGSFETEDVSADLRAVDRPQVGMLIDGRSMQQLVQGPLREHAERHPSISWADVAARPPLFIGGRSEIEEAIRAGDRDRAGERPA
jgi:hypothetical protein